MARLAVSAEGARYGRCFHVPFDDSIWMVVSPSSLPSQKGWWCVAPIHEPRGTSTGGVLPKTPLRGDWYWLDDDE